MLKFLQTIQSHTLRGVSVQPKESSPQKVDNVVREKAAVGSTPNTVQENLRSGPVVQSQYHEDPCFARILDLFLPAEIKSLAEADLAAFADAAVSRQVLDWLSDVERHPPKVDHWDLWGENKDELVTSDGWKFLWQFGVSEGLAAYPSLNETYQGYGRMIQMLKSHLYSASAASTLFRMTLSDGASRLLLMHLEGSKIDKQTRAVFQHAYDHLTSMDPLEAWSTGLWMTEKGGGSDLSPTETTATYTPLSPGDTSTDADGFLLGPWVLDGFKWFSTATEPSMAVVIARTPKGLSAFYVPMRRKVTVDGATKTELNGVRIRRLKNKLGTKGLPTAELEIKGMRGWMIGTDGKGINEIGIVLNVTRIHLAVTGLGAMSRALAAARAFARVRKVARGTKLNHVPLHMRTLSKVHITYRAHAMLGFFVTTLLAKSEEVKSPQVAMPHNLVPDNSRDTQCLLRLLGSVSKAAAAEATCTVTQVAMQSLGGVGYLENEEMEFNIARLHRDVVALTIGEGTADVLATDVVKVVKGKIGSYVMKALGRWVVSTTPKKESMTAESALLLQQWKELETTVASNSLEILTLNGREIMDHICRLVCGVLLLVDAARDDDPIAMEIARRWIRPVNALVGGVDTKTELSFDQRIVFGNTPI